MAKTKEEKLWVRVPDDVFASVEGLQVSIEKQTRIKPSVSQVVLMLLKRGLEGEVSKAGWIG